MSNEEKTNPLETVAADLRAMVNMNKSEAAAQNSNNAEENLTPVMLASAIKLAALSKDNEQRLTTSSIKTAIDLATIDSDANEKSDSTTLTPESLAMALKLVVNKTEEEDDRIRATIKTSVAMSRFKDAVTADILSDALKLVKE